MKKITTAYSQPPSPEQSRQYYPDQNQEQQNLIDWFEKQSYQSAFLHGQDIGKLLVRNVVLHDIVDASVADQQALRMQNEQLQEEVLANTYLANYDELTGLLNRRGLLQHGAQQFERLDRNVGVMFIDLNKFKAVNDTLGHAAGDQLLKQAAAIISANVRGDDLVGRLGGDEFAVIANTIPREGDDSTAEAKFLVMKDRIAESYQHTTGHTMSIGYTIYQPENPETLDQLFERADQHMYHIKAGFYHS